MILRCPKYHIIPVSANIDFMGEVVSTSANTASTITIITKTDVLHLR